MDVQTFALEKGEKTHSWILHTSLVVLSSFLIGLFAKITIPLPFTPVPLTMQPHVILVLAALLGSKRAVAAVFAFLVQGALGFPVFAGGVGGIAKFLGPTGGYFAGYLAAAFFVGYWVEQMRNRTSGKLLGVLAAGNALIFLFGVSYLTAFVGFKDALLLGVAPFIIGDLFKLLVGVRLLQWLRARR